MHVRFVAAQNPPVDEATSRKIRQWQDFASAWLPAGRALTLCIAGGTLEIGKVDLRALATSLKAEV